MTVIAVAVLLVLLLGWALVAGALERRNITGLVFYTRFSTRGGTTRRTFFKGSATWDAVQPRPIASMLPPTIATPDVAAPVVKISPDTPTPQVNSPSRPSLPTVS